MVKGSVSSRRIWEVHEDTLAVAFHKMAVGGFRHIPFVDHDGTTLLFSIQDVFRHVAPYIPHD